MTEKNSNARALLALVDEACASGVEIDTLQALVEEAAELGASRALHRLGLHDDDAGHDLRELRDLLDAWREARRAMWHTFIKWLTTFAMAALLTGLLVKFKFPFLNN